MFRRWIALLLGLLAPAGAAQDAQDPSDPFFLLKLSEEARAKLEANVKMSEDEEANLRVHRIGEQLLRVSDNALMRITFSVLDSTAPNALSYPKGYVYVHQGLAGVLKNDAHLAFAVAHEIAHICLLHSANLLKAHFLLKSLGKPTVQIEGKVRDYRQNDEFEADRYGLLYAVRAGYKLDKILSFFDLNLGDEEHLKDKSNHPSRAERKKRLVEFGEKLAGTVAVFEEGCRAYRRFQFDRSIAKFNEFLTFFPNSTAALTNVGAAYLRKASSFLESLPDGLRDELLFVPAADIQVRAPDRLYVQKALDCFQKAAGINPRWVAADLNTAAVHIRQGKRTEARAALDRAERFLDQDPFAAAVLRLHRGNLCWLQKDPAAALAHYEAALELDRRATAAAFNRALAMEKLDRKKEAIDALVELAKSPEWWDRASERLKTLGQAPPDRAEGEVSPETSLAGAGLGDAPEEIRKALGDPGKNNILFSSDGEEWSYEGGKLTLLFGLDEKGVAAAWVEVITVRDPAHKTARGVSVGDSAAKLKDRYGEPEKMEPLQGQWSYARGSLLFTLRNDAVTEITVALKR